MQTTPEQSFEMTDVVFLGTPNNLIEGENEHRYDFTIEQAWKETVTKNVTVTTATNSAACGVNFEIGTKYLIFADQSGNRFSTGLCSGNIQNPDQSIIASLDSPPADPTISGESGKMSATDFSDITNDHLNFEAIDWLYQNQFVSGFDDSSFRPNNSISRAAFVKMVIEANFDQAEINLCNETSGFTDVPQNEWFENYVCVATKNKIIDGYPDNTFRPGKNISFAAAAKILANIYELSTPSKQGEWYEPFIEALSIQRAIPLSIRTPEHTMTRAEVAEMIWRLAKKKTDQSSNSAGLILAARCENEAQAAIAGVDLERVRTTWLGYYNSERDKLGLPAYAYNNELERTAYIWSKYTADRGYMDHKRPGQTAYYDYNRIRDWFAAHGVTFKNINRVTFTENIGWGPYNCTSANCTDELISKIRQTFDFFLAERTESYRPHYESIVNPTFKQLGLGIAINEEQNRYYLTVHFGTEVTSTRPNSCE
jgi:uncharacterized protein YkwD